MEIDNNSVFASSTSIVLKFLRWRWMKFAVKFSDISTFSEISDIDEINKSKSQRKEKA
jgi:hypothetical protein